MKKMWFPFFIGEPGTATEIVSAILLSLKSPGNHMGTAGNHGTAGNRWNHGNIIIISVLKG